jgi:hypothetical protein
MVYVKTSKVTRLSTNVCVQVSSCMYIGQFASHIHRHEDIVLTLREMCFQNIVSVVMIRICMRAHQLTKRPAMEVAKRVKRLDRVTRYICQSLEANFRNCETKQFFLFRYYNRYISLPEN